MSKDPLITLGFTVFDAGDPQFQLDTSIQIISSGTTQLPSVVSTVNIEVLDWLSYFGMGGGELSGCSVNNVPAGYEMPAIVASTFKVS